ncbi:hypothetical protein EI012_26290, partial [Escherichia coli]|nr:hypothetical protein [Escherichia coli]
MATIESWAFRPTLPDSWFADYVVRDAETLTMALQKSISGGVAAAADGSFFPFSNLHNPDAAAAAPKPSPWRFKNPSPVVLPPPPTVPF